MRRGGREEPWGCWPLTLLLTLVPLSTGTVSLEVRLLEASQAFEVSQNGNLVVSGERGAGPQGVPLGSAQTSDP